MYAERGYLYCAVAAVCYVARQTTGENQVTG